MASRKGICNNTGRTHFKKGLIPWNKQEPVFVQCMNCNKSFQVSPCRKAKAKYCSMECRNISYIGKRYDDEYKKNMSRIAKQKGFGKWMFGKTLSEETKAKQRNSVKRGKDSNFWKGGISYKLYGKEFNKSLREAIRQRDNHRCQICGVPELELIKRLHIHHIDFNKENNSSQNLISLCNSCHAKTRNAENEIYWMNLLQNKIKEIYA